MIKVGISFKESGEDVELLEYLKEKSKIIGTSAYIKQLIYEQKLREAKKEK